MLFFFIELKENIDALLDSEADESTHNQSFSTQRTEVEIPTCHLKKRKRTPEAKSKLDDALDKLIAINKTDTVFEAFGENVGWQLSDFPELDAYEVMADMQLMLSNRKIAILKKDSSSNILHCAISNANISEEDYV